MTALKNKIAIGSTLFALLALLVHGFFAHHHHAEGRQVIHGPHAHHSAAHSHGHPHASTAHHHHPEETSGQGSEHGDAFHQVDETFCLRKSSTGMPELASLPCLAAGFSSVELASFQGKPKHISRNACAPPGAHLSPALPPRAPPFC